MASTTLAPDRAILAAAIFLTASLFVSDALDPVNVVKLVALMVCAVAVAALAAARVIRLRIVRLPVGPGAIAGLAFLASLVAATAVAPRTATAVYGALGRNSGLLAYGAALVLFVMGLRVLDVRSTHWVALGLLAAGVFTGTYGLLQYVGIDAVGWNNPFNPIIAAMGNPDFASAYLGITLPVAVWAALWTGWAPPWRILSAVWAAMLAGTAALSGAVQGPLAASAGLAVLLLAWLLDRSGRVRSAGSLGLAGVAASGLAVLLLGAAGTGPAAAFFSGISYRARTWYWEAAVAMFRNSPLWGVGLDSYGDRWRQERPLAATRELGGTHFSDAAHSVPLQMFAQGGLLLGLSYLFLVAVVAVALVRGLSRLHGGDRLLLGALGGSWTAYQVQSLVSIDQVPLIVAHFVLASAVLATASAIRLREIRLPGALPATPPHTRTRRRPAALHGARALAGVDVAALVLVAFAALTLSWVALSPLRASRAAFAGDAAVAQGNGDAAIADYQHAADLAPYMSEYLSKQGELYNRIGMAPKALEAYRAAAHTDPFEIGAVRTTGRLADATGDVALAGRMFRRAARLDPDNASTLLDLAQFLLRHQGAQAARTLLETAVQRLPADAELFATLGDARLVTGDEAGARVMYQNALRLQPGQQTAVAGLQKLQAGT